MEHNNKTFFSKKGSGPIVEMMTSKDPETPWPFTVRIRPVGGFGTIDFYVSGESELIRFKNSVLDAYRQHLVREGRL